MYATDGVAFVQDEDGEVVGARVRDVLQKKQQDVYARQVSIAQNGHRAEHQIADDASVIARGLSWKL